MNKKIKCQIKKLLLKYGIDIINNKKDYSISNNFDQNYFFTPYCELLYPDYSKNIYYDYLVNSNVIETIVLSDLNIEETDVVKNDKRFWLVNMKIGLIETFEDTVEFPNYKYIYFLNPNYDENNVNSSKTLDIYATFQKKTTLDMSGGSGIPYIETFVGRTNVFIYYPLSTLYLLINLNDKNNVKIYIMQSMTNLVNTTINSTNLCYLKSLLTLPDGWMFSVLTLDSKTPVVLIANSSTPAYVIQDDLSNSYQYVPRDQAEFLYDQFL